MPHPAYGRMYQRRVAALQLDPPVLCAHCKMARATTLDHDPPIAMHKHREGLDCCRLIPSCEACNRRGGALVAQGLWRPGALTFLGGEEPERVGLDRMDRRWRVPWIRPLVRSMPGDATWPRYMTVPHPRAVGSLGDEFVEFAQERTARLLRWWQRLAAVRMLEVDGDGRLVWEEMVLTTARQVGKSWLLRELCLWRMLQAERFGEPQDVLHTGKDLAVCKEIQRPARVWAKADRERFKVREVNGQEEIEHIPDGSRWMLRAKEAVYGYSVGLGVVDEAWKVRASSVDEGLTPTMVEREQPQLLLTSTAHRKATALMLDRRHAGLNRLEDGDGPLLIEWSAPLGLMMDDREGWRAASPHWTDRRERLIQVRHDAMRTGESSDPDEPDPEQSFRCQWLNQWPGRMSDPNALVEPLLADGVWAERAVSVPAGAGPVWVALEDDYGLGAAVACARLLDDGRVELDGWLQDSWDAAVADVEGLRAAFPVRRVLVGATLAERVPPAWKARPHGAVEVRKGLALLRDLAMTGGVIHDEGTGELDETFGKALVREGAAGLTLERNGAPLHLVRAAVWALAGAHARTPMPTVH